MNFLLLLLLPHFAQAQVAPVRSARAQITITRSFITWLSRDGEMNQETVCSQELLVPVYDFRAHPELRPQAESVELSCASKYRDQIVPILLSGRVELVTAEDFGLNLPKETELKRTFFTLEVGAGGSFPYRKEIQKLAGWQLFTEDLTLRSQIFQLSPEAFLMIQCGELGCHEVGPQSVYRAQVTLTDSPIP